MSTDPPLAGQRVLVTRPAGQAEALRAALADAGAAVTSLPTIRLDPPPDPGPLRRAARELAAYDWVVVTSVNAVERLAAALERFGDPSRLRQGRVAAVGPATAEALCALGCEAPLVPPVYRGEALADSVIAAIPAERRTAARVLVVQAELGRPVLRDRLRAAGAAVDVAPAYSVGVNWDAREALLEFVELARGDWLTFTASSAVRAFVELVGAQTGGASIAAISPLTAATAAQLGLPVHAVATRHTGRGLVEALIDATGAERAPQRESVR